MPVKDSKRIRLFGGNNFQLKTGSNQWTSLGHLITGTLEDKTDSQEITFADGTSIDLDGKRKVKLTLTLAQTGKEELDKLEELRGTNYPGYYYNGVVGGKKQAFYFKELNIIPSYTLKSPDNPMNVVIEFNVVPQESIFSVNTDSDLNTTFEVHQGSDTEDPEIVESKNVFYAIIEK